MRISDWSSDVCSSDLPSIPIVRPVARQHRHQPNCYHCPKPRRQPRGGRENSHRLRDAIKSIMESRKLPSIFAIGSTDSTRPHTACHESLNRFACGSDLLPPRPKRSEERRVGKECVSTCRSRWSPYHSKKKNKQSQCRRNAC